LSSSSFALQLDPELDTQRVLEVNRRVEGVVGDADELDVLVTI